MTVHAQALVVPWQVEYGNGTHTGIADTSKSGVGGQGGLRPHELLESALATCMAITARLWLAERDLDDTGLVVSVDVVREETSTRFQYALRLPRALESHRAELLAVLETCPVRRTLSKPITFAATAQGSLEVP